MKRNYSATDISVSKNQELIRQIAYHEAGHAAAIYLCNQQKQLPPVFFKISIKQQDGLFDFPVSPIGSGHDNCIAKVEGGRLIHALPISINIADSKFSNAERQAYLKAYEVDVINILVGPLAEAKYVALRDGELINPNLVNIDALKFYGGSSDLEIVNEYLDCFISEAKLREEKVIRLFQEAYEFIDSNSNWQAISALANYILSTQKSNIECEEAITVLDLNRVHYAETLAS